eukprot:2107456-Rhodomonas_salina.1
MLTCLRPRLFTSGLHVLAGRSRRRRRCDAGVSFVFCYAGSFASGLWAGAAFRHHLVRWKLILVFVANQPSSRVVCVVSLCSPSLLPSPLPSGQALSGHCVTMHSQPSYELFCQARKRASFCSYSCYAPP